MPPDLVRAKPGDAPPNSSGQQPLGRYDETGKFVPYHDRTAIEQGALMGKGLEIGWAADALEFFFLQVQGSGRSRLSSPVRRLIRPETASMVSYGMPAWSRKALSAG